MTDTTLAADHDRAVPQDRVQTTVFAIILAVSLGHMINDIMQSLLAAIYPMLKTDFQLDFWQIGLLTMAFQVTASLLQPLIGMYTDKRPLPYSLPVGMASSLVGLVVLGFAPNYALLVVGAMLIGFGSAIFHPESSRVARLASGGRFGLAQSVFQLGGNFGQAIGPLLAAFIVVPFGQTSVSWFTLAAAVGIVVLWQVGGWYSAHLRERAHAQAARLAVPGNAEAHRGDCAGRADHPHLQQERLHGQPVQLLHLLRHPQVRRVGAGFAADAVPVPRRVGGRAGAGRPVRRPLRRQDGDLVLDPRRAAVHAGLALCRPVVDQHPGDRDRR